VVQNEERSRKDGAAIGLRAAQYVRMSTDFQRYSLENQAAGIAAFAASRNLTIVRTYEDKGRSGLRFGNRRGLQSLIADVEGRRADFDFVLVYDVTRWGRFQDVDESAYYEFICRRAGVRVLYCAEQFENDGSFVSAIMKNIKRVSAGDFSRDLSVKVFAGSCRLVRLGFKQGGIAGYGLERVLIDQSGAQRCILAPGDRKVLMTDRVILRPGKPEEVETVRRVFRSFVHERKTELEIARELNEQGTFNQLGRPWRMLSIRRLLACDKYIGNYVYNRKSGKLKGKRIPNPPDLWVRCDNAFEGIIDPALFKAAAKIIERRPRRTLRAWKSDAQMLNLLRELLERKGRLTSTIIEDAAELPCHMTYIERFGSLRRAYGLIGYHPDTFKVYDARQSAIATRARLANELLSAIQGGGRSAAFDAKSGRVTIAPTLTVSILIVRCQRLVTGSLRWPVRRRIDPDTSLTLVVRMREDNDSFLDFYLLSTRRALKPRLTFRKQRQAEIRPYRLTTVEAITDAIERAARAPTLAAH
jgi:DNA invertase Pin-like site-specific DNA recombinase